MKFSRVLSKLLISFGLPSLNFQHQGPWRNARTEAEEKIESLHCIWTPWMGARRTNLHSFCSSARLCIISSLLSNSKPLYLLINEVILVCQLFYHICASLSVNESITQCSSLILSYTTEEKPWTCTCPITMSFCTTCSLLLFFFFGGSKCKGTLLLIKGPFCILSIKSCLIIITTVCQWNK